ncbi:MAG: chlorite dismutase family protein, partial [Akkermansiaceae bacterium]
MTPLPPKEGWHVLHLFYHIDYSQWAMLGDDEKRQAKVRFTELIQEIRATPDTQLLTFSIVSPKADLGFMLLTPDLHVANSFEKQLSLSLGPEILTPAYSYFSITEPSEYTTTREQYIAETLIAEKNLSADSEEYATALKEFDERMAHYRSYRVYPQLPDWPIVCFYPMTKRRSGNDNWYSLDYETR